MHDRVRTQQRDRLHHRVVVAHVELVVRERVDLVMGRHLLQERPSEAAGGPGDDQPHRPAPAARGSVTTGTSCARRSQVR